MKSSVSPYNYLCGLRDGLPIGIGYLSVSFGFGISTVGQGLRAIEAILISMTNLTGTGQVAGVAIIAAGGTVIEMILTQLVISLRYALMGISLTQKLDTYAKPWWKRLYLCFALTDEIYAVTMTKPDSVGPSYLRGAFTAPYVGWILGTILGSVVGAVLPERLENALGIMVYAMFLAIIIPPMRREKGVFLAVALGAGLRCVMTYVPALSFISEGFAIILCSVPAALVVSIFFPIADEEDKKRDSD